MPISNLQTLTAGSVIERVFWTAPDLTGKAVEYEKPLDALTAAVERRRRTVARYLARYPDEATRPIVPERVTLDLCWGIRHPERGTFIVVAKSHRYATLAEAERHLSLLTRGLTYV